jgi:hypothetical protein
LSAQVGVRRSAEQSLVWAEVIEQDQVRQQRVEMTQKRAQKQAAPTRTM